MKVKHWLTLAAVVAVAMACASVVRADTLELNDGTVINNCFVQDEAIRYNVWEKMSDVGTATMKVFSRSQVKNWKKQRDDSWNTRPTLPDLSVTFIEMTPKLAGLHGLINYDDKMGAPIPKGATTMVDVGDRVYMEPEEVVKNMKLSYKPGEDITLTAHVKNLGFVAAKPFAYTWLIDGKEAGKGKYSKALKEMEETSFPMKWKWQDGQYTVTFKVLTTEKEIGTANNEATDPLWGWGLTYVVSNGKAKAWHQIRTAVGTFSFEDYYRWHIDMMNTLFAASVYPSAPEGIKARVRLDRIVYTNGDVQQAIDGLVSPDGLRYDQGGWNWINDEDKNQKWEPASKQWRNSTEWSLPHELGHQLGLTDWYALDCDGSKDHVWPDTGEQISHFMSHPSTMMHWHGPQVYSEVDAGYFNAAWHKPRGYFGDYYFAIPRENFLDVVDVNGEPVVGAKVEIFQRGVVVDTNGQPGEDQGVKYFPVVEDGNFDQPVSKDAVIVGTTGEDGILRLPNRPVSEVKTLNGYYRQPNPFGNINVVGNRGIMLVKVTKNDRPTYFYLEIYNFNVACYRGHKDKYTTVLKTPYGSFNSPRSPIEVKAEPVDKDHVKITWTAPKVIHEQQYLDRVVGYKVYRRIGPMGLNDRPWFPVATLNPDTKEFIVDLTQKPYDVEWFGNITRFAVSSLGEESVESELVEAPVPQAKK